MKEREVINYTVNRLKEDYIKYFAKESRSERGEFNNGVLLGINIVLTSLKNDLIGLEDSCLDNENNIADFGLDFDIDEATT